MVVVPLCRIHAIEAGGTVDYRGIGTEFRGLE